MKNNNHGITMVALVITSIIILVMAAVAIGLVTGDKGLFSMAEKSANQFASASKNELETLDILLEDISTSNINVNVEDEEIYYIGKKIEISSGKEIKTITLNGKNIKNGTSINETGQYNLYIQDKAGLEKTVKFYVNDGLLALIKDKELDAGVQAVEVNGVTYNINLIKYDGDLVLDGETQNSVSTLTAATKTYEVGNVADVATASAYAANTVVLKVNGNLTVEENVILTAVKNASGYGGPKGMFIYVTGILTNNGEISMTARGARAEGQNVYLWQNADGEYEVIPAVGGQGGTDDTLYYAVNYGSTYKVYGGGRNGEPGKVSEEKRGLGGGGSGAIYVEGSYSNKIAGYISNGASATSYSGGSAGGSVLYIQDGINSAKTATRYNAESNGGAGARGYSADTSSAWTRFVGGGAGNPGGKGYKEGTAYPTLDGENGTGGLLIIYGNSVINNGMLSSKGSSSKTITTGSNQSFRGGGSSGGGSINVFYRDNIEPGNISVVSGTAYSYGGKGGNGTFNIGKIVDGTYEGIQTGGE